jgi:hypothetical protein
MKETLLAMLIVASWTQEEGDESVKPAFVKSVVSVRATVDESARKVTIEVPFPARLPVDVTTVVVARENFDSWVFGDRDSEKEPRAYLEQLLSVRIDGAARAHKLTHRQQAKLRLAGRGDIKRFFDRVEDARNDFEFNRVGFKNGLAALRRLKPLSKDYDLGPFDDGSLFAKTLYKINNDKAASN